MIESFRDSSQRFSQRAQSLRVIDCRGALDIFNLDSNEAETPFHARPLLPGKSRGVLPWH
jgi:hypothetical protein